MLIGIATAVPPYKVDQKTAADELKKRMAPESKAAQRMIDMAAAQSGISVRSVVIPDGSNSDDKKFYSDPSGYLTPDTKSRMLQYEYWSKYLVENAVKEVLADTGVNSGEIERIITISCTGFTAPGFDQHIIEKFNLPRTIRRTHIGFMGCAASIVGFNNVLEALSLEKESNILMVSCEICSLHLQLEPTRDNILANMIFADGAAAVLFSNSMELSKFSKLKLLNTKSIIFPSSSEYMGWKIGNRGFEMILSSELPKIIINEAVPAAIKILDTMGIKRERIKYWALHPGGRAILDSLEKGLSLTAEEIEPSRKVLNCYGNTSSVSILFVLKELITRELEKEEYLCAIAFGPGLSMELALFKTI